MRFLIPSLVLFIATSLVAADDYDKELLAQQKREYRVTSATFLPCPGDKSIVAAHWVQEDDWWSFVQVYHFKDGKFDWEVELPPKYVEDFGCYVVSYRWVRNEPSDQWMLEVSESTHMGNGGLWLLALEGKKLRVVLHTHTIGRFWDHPEDIKVPFLGTVRFPEKHLKAVYQRDSVVFSGRLRVLDGDDEVSTVPYSEVWKWNKEKRIFEKEK